LELINNRIIPSILIVFVVFISYFFSLDSIFLILISTLIFIDLKNSDLLSSHLCKVISLIFIIIISSSFYFDFKFNIYLIALNIFIFILSFINRNFIKEIFVTLIWIYVFSIFILMNENRDSLYLFLLISFINDTTAYLVGKNIKGPLIIPSISPNKTWSGTSTSIILIFFIMLYFDYSLFLSILFSLLFFIGDIYFSFIKRLLKIKDFSKTLLGHGGVLDRLDSMYFVIFTLLII
jgi:phosphatidate cytidylyltransferase